MANHMLDANQVLVEAFDIEKGIKVDIGTTSINLPTTPLIENIAITTANDKVRYAFPENAREAVIRVRGGMAKLQLYLGNSDNYITIEKGCSFKLTNVSLSSLPIDISSDKDNQVIELLFWT